MKILAIANAGQEQEISRKNTNVTAEFSLKREMPAIEDCKIFDAFFILDENLVIRDAENFWGKPVFINCVIDTLSGQNLPDNFNRINGWPGFLQREIWEVASNKPTEAKSVFDILGWKLIFVKDQPGLVAARVISMIINEAFFAFDEKISTKEEIDLAMKLGTNYPFGPFEWAEKIGLCQVYDLLKKLNESDARYIPSVALENCILKSNKIESR